MGGFGTSISSLFPPEPEELQAVLRREEASRTGIGQLTAAASYCLSLGEGKDPYHAMRVAYISARIADVLRLSDHDLQAAIYGGLLHDIGIAGLGPALSAVADASDIDIWAQLPHERLDTVAEVAGRRKTKIEELLISHTRRGQRIAADLPLPDGADEVVFSHHETWDGSGFPYGETGQRTCAGARIVSFAEAIDAQARVQYDDPSVQSYLFEYAKSESRQRFDGEIVGAFAALTRDEHFWEELSDQELPRALWAWIDDLPLNSGRLRDALWTLADVFDSRSSYRTAHSAGVASYAQLLAGRMGYRGEEVDALRMAALIHDLGMLGVPTVILDKTAPLTELEWQQVRRHARYSRDALTLAPSIAEPARIASQHHEWVNGQGYPDGLAGTRICTMARILSTADGFESLTSDRAYRPAFDPAAALESMRTRSGRQYDPTILDVLSEVIEEYVVKTDAEEPPSQTRKAA